MSPCVWDKFQQPQLVQICTHVYANRLGQEGVFECGTHWNLPLLDPVHLPPPLLPPYSISLFKHTHYTLDLDFTYSGGPHVALLACLGLVLLQSVYGAFVTVPRGTHATLMQAINKFGLL